MESNADMGVIRLRHIERRMPSGLELHKGTIELDYKPIRALIVSAIAAACWAATWLAA